MAGTQASDARMVGNWELLKHIGSGSFAVVWKARHCRTGEVMAIKEISMDKLNGKLKQSLESEVSILRQITHQNVVKLHDVVEARNKLYLIMEYCGGGDLSAYIHRHKRVTEATARGLMRQLASGLEELRSHQYVHRDLKPQNLLLSSQAPDAVLKIADFGFARPLQPQGLAETLCGSPLYMAPEILSFQKYDAKADLWSVGTILFELITGRPPFNGNNHVHLLRNIEASDARLPPAIAAQLSPSALDMIHKLLRRNPVQRISFPEFFTHAFLYPPGTLPPSQEAVRSHSSLGGPGSTSQGSSTQESTTIASHSGASNEGAASRGLGSPVLQAGMRTSLETAVGLQLPAARYVASPAICMPDGHPGHLAESQAHRPQSLPMHDSLADEEDYVIVDPAPSTSASSQASRSRQAWLALVTAILPRIRSTFRHPALAPLHVAPSRERSQGASALPSHQTLSQPPTPSARTDEQSAQGRPSSGSGQAQLLGSHPSRDTLLRVAHIMDSLGLEKASQSQAAAALSLYLMTLQVLQAALEQAVKRPGQGQGSLAGDASSITGAMRDVALRAEQAAARTPAGGDLPDAWELLYASALMLARSAAVDELLGDHSKCIQDYSRAGTLLQFLASEASHLALHPALELEAADRVRLQKYTASIFARHAAAQATSAAAAAAGAGASDGVAATAP